MMFHLKVLKEFREHGRVRLDITSPVLVEDIALLAQIGLNPHEVYITGVGTHQQRFAYEQAMEAWREVILARHVAGVRAREAEIQRKKDAVKELFEEVLCEHEARFHHG